MVQRRPHVGDKSSPLFYLRCDLGVSLSPDVWVKLNISPSSKACGRLLSVPWQFPDSLKGTSGSTLLSPQVWMVSVSHALPLFSSPFTQTSHLVLSRFHPPPPCTHLTQRRFAGPFSPPRRKDGGRALAQGVSSPPTLLHLEPHFYVNITGSSLRGKANSSRSVSHFFVASAPSHLLSPHVYLLQIV